MGIADLPDPQERYDALLVTYPQLLDVRVVVPDILDSNGVCISPAHYTEKCNDGQIVEVEVILKM